MYQFAELFDAVPLPAPAATGQQQTRSQHPATRAPPRQVAQRNASAAQEGKGGAQKTEVGFKKTENEPQTLVAATLNRVWTSLDAVGTVFAHLPPGCSGVFQSTSGTGTRPPYAGPRAPNPFPPLKSGRRNVILAVVDNGTTSLLRFGEAEFAKWRLAGENGPGWGT